MTSIFPASYKKRIKKQHLEYKIIFIACILQIRAPFHVIKEFACFFFPLNSLRVAFASEFHFAFIYIYMYLVFLF